MVLLWTAVQEIQRLGRIGDLPDKRKQFGWANVLLLVTLCLRQWDYYPWLEFHDTCSNRKLNLVMKEAQSFALLTNLCLDYSYYISQKQVGVFLPKRLYASLRQVLKRKSKKKSKRDACYYFIRFFLPYLYGGLDNCCNVI